MTQVIGIGGLPATGKTSLMREIIARCGPSYDWQFNLLRGHTYDALPVTVLGIYDDGQTFAGTDRLSMAVLRDARRYVWHYSRDAGMRLHTILFEGDRLFTHKFVAGIRSLPSVDLKLYMLKAQPDVLAARHAARDRQGESWLAGRKTKLANLCQSFPDIQAVPSNNQADAAQALKTILNDVFTYAQKEK